MKSLKLFLQNLLSVICAIVISFSAHAAGVKVDTDRIPDESTLLFYAENNLFWYDPTGYIVGQGFTTFCASTADGQGSNLTYSGQTIVNDTFLEQVSEGSELREIYDRVSTETGIPWQVFATIHYMESGLSETSNNAFGYTPDGYNNGFGNNVINIEDQLRYVANEVILKIINGEGNGKPLDLTNENDIKRLFFYYNSGKYVRDPNGSDRLYDRNTGQALYDARGIPLYVADPKGDWQRGYLMYGAEGAENGEGSIYVMNMADAKRDPISGGAELDSLWLHVGDKWYSGHPGAFLVYQALGGTGHCHGIPSGGVTSIEEARDFVQDYINDMVTGNWEPYLDKSSYDIGKEYANGIGGANCVTYVKYYVTKYLGTDLRGVSTGNGKDVAGFLINNYDFDEIFTPEAGAIFSYNTSGGFGHTGVILGIDESTDSIYLGQAAYEEDIYWGTKDENLRRSLSDFMRKPDLRMAKPR